MGVKNEVIVEAYNLQVMSSDFYVHKVPPVSEHECYPYNGHLGYIISHPDYNNVRCIKFSASGEHLHSVLDNDFHACFIGNDGITHNYYCY